MIRNNCRAVLMCLLIAGSTALFAQRRETTMAMRGDRTVAETSYRTIADATSLSERRELLQSLPLESQGDVWLLHYHHFLERHSELTLRQRELIMEIIGVLASDLPGELDGISDVASESRLQRFLARARTEFPRELYLEAFAQPGPRSNLAPVETKRSPSKFETDQVSPAPHDDCNCNLNNDFCNDMTGTTPYCSRKSCKLTNAGCGILWLNACNGVCAAGPY